MNDTLKEPSGAVVVVPFRNGISSKSPVAPCVRQAVPPEKPVLRWTVHATVAPPIGAFAWPLAEADGCLGDTDADVWCARLDAPPGVLQACQAVVSPDELERAGRFRFDRERQRYLAGRGLLRQLLAGYLRCPAKEMVFAYSPTGKPSPS